MLGIYSRLEARYSKHLHFESRVSSYIWAVLYKYQIQIPIKRDIQVQNYRLRPVISLDRCCLESPEFETWNDRLKQFNGQRQLANGRIHRQCSLLLHRLSMEMWGTSRPRRTRRPLAVRWLAAAATPARTTRTAWTAPPVSTTTTCTSATARLCRSTATSATKVSTITTCVPIRQV